MFDNHLPEGWVARRLSELGVVDRGRSRHRPRHDPILYGGQYPFIQTGDIKASGGRITEYSQTYNEIGLAQSRLWPAGTLCITIAANIAETAILTFPACFPDSVIGFIADESKCNVWFVAYVLMHLRKRIQHIAEDGGTVQDNINLEFLEQVRFPAPRDVGEQAAIACVLKSLDDKIELNRQMNRTLEAMAQALFKSWFVDFDPVVAKAAGRQPFAMERQTAHLFPDRFTRGDLGTLPTGWCYSRIGEEVEVVGGSTPSTQNPEYWNGEICWATPKDLSVLVDPVLIATERRITPAGLDTISSGLLPPGTVLLSSRAPIGYLAVADTPVAINQGFIAMICNRALDSHFVLHWAREATDEILSRAGGTTFAEISKRNFRPIPVVVPDDQVLAAWRRQAVPLHRKLVANVRENLTLSATRDALLPKLLSGELHIRDTEKLAERAGA